MKILLVHLNEYSSSALDKPDCVYYNIVIFPIHKITMPAIC